MQRSLSGREAIATQRPEESRLFMKDLEKMQQWLQSYPGWEDTLQVDITEPAPGNAGLFTEGLEVLSRKEDILGNVQLTCRYRFTLYRRVARDNGASNARWLLDFQNWVQQQSALGLAPQFGDEPHLEQIQARKGALKERGQTGIYTVTLLADFTREYKRS